MPLRTAVAKLCGLKHTPELHFRRNTVPAEQSRLEEVWQARSATHALLLLVACSAVFGRTQELERERNLEGQHEEQHDAESEEDDEAPPPAAQPRAVPL